jgi:Xaa-Pro aminopeptidase
MIFLPWQQLQSHVREALTTRGGNGGARRIAMQYTPENAIPYISRVDAGTIELIRSFGVEPVSSADLVARFEAVWTEAQYESHIKAANNVRNIIQQAFAEIGRRIKSGEPTNEYDIQQFMVRRFEEEGMTCDGDHPIVSVNGNSAIPHYGPTSEKHSPIKQGDFVLLDVWAKLKEPGAVYADQTWTGYVGETVPERYTHIFNIVRDARDAAVAFVQECISSGREIKGADVDDVSRDVIVKAGYGAQFLHRTGHSIGEEVHGNGANIDNLETRDSRKIIPHTCFSIEPGIYLEGDFGVRSELDVYVSDTEASATGQPVQTKLVAILA